MLDNYISVYSMQLSHSKKNIGVFLGWVTVTISGQNLARNIFLGMNLQILGLKLGLNSGLY